MHGASSSPTKALLVVPLIKRFRCRSSLSFSSSSAAIAELADQFPIFHPNPSRFSHLLNRRPTISQLNQILAQVITQSFQSQSSLIHSLISCYIFRIDLTAARALFDRYPLPSPPTLLFNLMMRAHSKLQNSPESINFFCRMITLDRCFGVHPDEYTFTFLITSCSHQTSKINGEIVHGLVMKNGYESNLYVRNSLINMYSVFSEMENAHKVFDKMPDRDVFSWTSLVRGYAKYGDIAKAIEMFDKMPVRNNVSWAVIISCFVGNERYIEALRYFRNMFCDNNNSINPNEAVLVCALSACAHLGALKQGNWIHSYIDKSGIPKSSNIYTALIDMYTKCGRIAYASGIFNEISQPDVQNFTSMISGLSIHGLGKDSLRVFDQMLAENVKPNNVTILAVLNGCNHSGLIEEGSSIFNKMDKLWEISPKIEHYGCYIDLLGRAGYLEKAFGIVKNMPFEPDIIIWRSLLSACRIHRDVNRGEWIVNHIKVLNLGYNCGAEVLLSNLYTSPGRWDNVPQVRKLMDKKKNKRSIGCSWIEVKGIVHEFRVDDQIHPRILEIREELTEIFKRVSLGGGYVANTMQVSFDLGEEEREHAVVWHSE